jgi:hypothetical protein
MRVRASHSQGADASAAAAAPASLQLRDDVGPCVLFTPGRSVPEEPKLSGGGLLGGLFKAAKVCISLTHQTHSLDDSTD